LIHLGARNVGAWGGAALGAGAGALAGVESGPGLLVICGISGVVELLLHSVHVMAGFRLSVSNSCTSSYADMHELKME
jgi:hypothetical protein